MLDGTEVNIIAKRCMTIPSLMVVTWLLMARVAPITFSETMIDLPVPDSVESTSFIETTIQAGGPDGSQDGPGTLYSTIAQISATFVAILGGFVLQYGISLNVEMRRIKRKLARARQAYATRKSEMEDDRESQRQFIAALELEKRESFRNLMTGEVSPSKFEAELERLRDKLFDIQKCFTFRGEQRLEVLKSEANVLIQIQDDLDDVSVQITHVRLTLRSLLVLAFFGVGIPLILIPSEYTGVRVWEEIMVKLFSIIVLGATLWTVIILMFSEPPLPSLLRHFKSLRSRHRRTLAPPT